MRRARATANGEAWRLLVCGSDRIPALVPGRFRTLAHGSHHRIWSLTADGLPRIKHRQYLKDSITATVRESCTDSGWPKTPGGAREFAEEVGKA